MTMQTPPAQHPTYQQAITTLMDKLSISREEAVTKVTQHFARKGWSVDDAPIVMAATPVIEASPVDPVIEEPEAPTEIEASEAVVEVPDMTEVAETVAPIVEVVAAPAPVAAAPVVKAAKVEKAAKLPKEPKVAAPKAPKAEKVAKQVVWMEIPMELHGWVIQHCKDQGTPMTRYIRDLIIADRASKDAPQA